MRKITLALAAIAALAIAAPAEATVTLISEDFSSGFGVKIAPAAKLVTRRRRQVPRTAPRILLSSKESISDQAPGLECRL